LYYNPYSTPHSITYINEKKGSVDLYDAVNHKVVAKNIRKEKKFEIPADQARVIVVLPHKSEVTKKNGRYYVGINIVAYQ
jgi:hypothetical protein